MLNQQPWMAHAASAIIADAADAVAIAASARFKAHWMFIRYGNNFIILPVHVSCVCFSTNFQERRMQNFDRFIIFHLIIEKNDTQIHQIISHPKENICQTEIEAFFHGSVAKLQIRTDENIH